jgi:glycosyltransferase involved in cell wall biosynthesis
VSGSPPDKPAGWPRIAVIIPCYDDGAFLGQALSSIEEREPVELVVVDDGSVDTNTLATLAELERGGQRVLRHERNRGVAAARMTGLAATSAPFVFPLDADDLGQPGSLEAMADRLEATPDAGVCFGDYLEFGDSSLVRAVPDWLDPYRIAYTNEYPVSSLFRRSLLDAVGGWRSEPGKVAFEDWDLWMRLAERGERGVHAGRGVITYRRRLHGERLLQRGKRRHKALYRGLRADHPALFTHLRDHRRRSDLSGVRKLAYPFVYGGRRRLPLEPRVKALLDRHGIWTLRR